MKNDHFLAKGINVSCGTVDGFAYIYLEDRREFLKLDEVGSFIWSQINGRRTVNGVVARCLGVYEGDRKEIIKSVKEFIDVLLAEGVAVSSPNTFEGVMQNG